MLQFWPYLAKGSKLQVKLVLLIHRFPTWSGKISYKWYGINMWFQIEMWWVVIVGRDAEVAEPVQFIKSHIGISALYALWASKLLLETRWLQEYPISYNTVVCHIILRQNISLTQFHNNLHQISPDCKYCNLSLIIVSNVLWEPGKMHCF